MVLRTLRTRLLPLALFTLTGSAGCPAVYPELSTRLRLPVAQQVLQPPPPEDLRWIRFIAGRVPERTRDGRTWDQVLSSLPDPYARLLINGKEVLRTTVESDTLEPTWLGSPGGNFRVEPEDRLQVELWDANPINDKPIGVRDIGRPSMEERESGEIRVELEGGGRLTFAFEPAHARIGLGLWYELRTNSAFITRTMEHGPADRAGLRRGDEILMIGGRQVKMMSPDEIRTAFNAVKLSGIVLMVKHADGPTETMTVAEGPVYPAFDQFGAID